MRAIFLFLYKTQSNALGEKILGDLRGRIHRRVYEMSLDEIQAVTPSQILIRMTGDVQNIRQFVFCDFLEGIYAGIQMVCISVILLVINVKLTVVAFVFLPFTAFCYGILYPETKKGYQDLRHLWGLFTSRMQEVLQGIRTVHVYTARTHEKNIFNDFQARIFALQQKNQKRSVLLSVIVESLTVWSGISVLWVGAQAVKVGQMTVGGLVAYYSYLGMLFVPVIRMVLINTSWQEASASMRRIEDVFCNKKKAAIAKGISIEKIRGHVEFRKVSFAYVPGKPVLEKISFIAEPGRIIAIVGASGAGKTTLVNLLCRFFEPTEGEILIDGIPLNTIDAESYRRYLSVVLQEDFLFDETVRQNICYGSFDADQASVEAAARIAEIHGDILQWPQQYETKVGERGVQLSSGQRQRIAIARAFLKKASVFVFDEATSSVDALTENRIQENIRKSLRGRTVFVVAHRFSTIADADHILVLDHGRVVESGTHAGLLKEGGFYSRLYQEQFKVGLCDDTFSELPRV